MWVGGELSFEIQPEGSVSTFQFPFSIFSSLRALINSVGTVGLVWWHSTQSYSQTVTAGHSPHRD